MGGPGGRGAPTSARRRPRLRANDGCLSGPWGVDQPPERQQAQVPVAYLGVAVDPTSGRRLRIVQVEGEEPFDPELACERVEGPLVAFLGGEVETRRVRVAGVEAYAHRVAAAGAFQHRRHLVEPAAEAAPLAGGDLEQQPGTEPARSRVDLGQRCGGGVDARLSSRTQVGARMQDHEVEAQLLGAHHLLLQRVAALAQDHRIAGGEVDEVRRVRHDRPPDGGVLAPEQRHLVRRRRPGAPLLRRAGEDLQRLAAVGPAPADGVPGPAGDRFMGAQQHIEIVAAPIDEPPPIR